MELILLQTALYVIFLLMFGGLFALVTFTTKINEAFIRRQKRPDLR